MLPALWQTEMLPDVLYHFLRSIQAAYCVLLAYN